MLDGMCRLASVLCLCFLSFGCGRIGFGTSAEPGSRDAETADAGLDGASPAVDAGEDDGGAACVPTTEVCNGADDDCDGDTDEDLGTPLCGAGETCASGACTGAMAHVWDRTYGDTVVDHVEAVATDADGNIYAVGSFTGFVDFGDGLRSAPVEDIFVLKLASDGSFHWARTLGGSGPQRATGVAVDGAGNVYVVGSAGASTDLGSGERRVGNGTAFVLALSADGGHRWDRMYEVLSGSSPRPSIQTTSTGDVVVGLPIDLPVNFDGGARTPGGSDIAILNLDSDGLYLWDRVVGGSGSDFFGGVAIGPGDAVILAGSFEDSVDLGGGERTTGDAAFSAFVLRLDAAGAYVWDTTTSGAPFSEAHSEAVAVDPAGNVYVAGWSDEPVNFGGGLRPNPSFADMFVWSLDADGTYRWDHTVESDQTILAHAIATGSSGEVAVGGSFRGSVDFGGGTREGTPSSKAGFLLGLDSSGAYLWDYYPPGGLGTAVNAIATGRPGSVVAVGYFGDTIDFGGGEQTSAGETDTFILSLEPAR